MHRKSIFSFPRHFYLTKIYKSVFSYATEAIVFSFSKVVFLSVCQLYSALDKHQLTSGILVFGRTDRCLIITSRPYKNRVQTKSRGCQKIIAHRLKSLKEVLSQVSVTLWVYCKRYSRFIQIKCLGVGRGWGHSYKSQGLKGWTSSNCRH